MSDLPQDPSAPPVPTRPTPSSTAVLARQGARTVEVYLLRRSAKSQAFPGVYVFPGGVLEADDRRTGFWRQQVDLPADRLSGVLGGAVEELLPFAVAAIRETFEEADLLVADGPPTGSRTSDGRRGGVSFGRRMADGGLRLALSRLGRWSHWISPMQMPQRFDTYFFVIPVEPNRECRPDNRETVHGMWIDPATALAGNADGRFPLSPPTLVTLHDLAHFDDLDDLMAEARRRPWPEPLMPRLWRLQKDALIIEPWDPDYDRETVSVDVDGLEAAVLPAGAPFSRLWMRGGRFLPVRRPDGGQPVEAGSQNEATSEPIKVEGRMTIDHRPLNEPATSGVRN